MTVHRPRPILRALWLLPLLLLYWMPAPLQAQEAEKPVVAVLDLEMVEGTAGQTMAITSQLHQELFKTGAYKMSDRTRVRRWAAEQGTEEAPCRGGECALEVGRQAGARMVATGTISKVPGDKNIWQISVVLVDISSGETVAAESITHEGSLVGLLQRGIPQLAAGLAGVEPPEQSLAALPPLGEEDEAEAPPADSEKRRRWPHINKISGSPLGFYNLSLFDKDGKELERIDADGYVVEYEHQFDWWSVGGSYQWGDLTESDVSVGTDVEGKFDITGKYSKAVIHATDGRPWADPWFFYGFGVFYSEANYTMEGVERDLTVSGIEFLMKFIYTFDNGILLGYVVELPVSSSFSGSRIDEYEAAGIKVSDVFLITDYVTVGFSW